MFRELYNKKILSRFLNFQVRNKLEIEFSLAFVPKDSHARTV
jgi:hypothetical protein